MHAKKYPHEFAPLDRFQWRTNGADGRCAIIKSALGKGMAQTRCANAFPSVARLWRNSHTTDRRP